MKALFILNDPSLFEEGSLARVQMKEYAEAIGELHVLSSVGLTYSGESIKKDGALTLYAFRDSRMFKIWRLSFQAHRLILKEGIEVVSAQDPFEYGQAAAIAVKGTKAKLHIQIHTDFLSPWFVRSHITRSPQTRVPSMNRIRQSIADRVLPKAHGIRVVSKRIQDSLTARYGSRIVQPVVIPESVSSSLPPAIPLPTHFFTFVVMVIGRLEPEKRIEDILVAFARIKDKYPSLGFVIVGDGHEHDRLKHWADVLGVSARVFFLGERSETEAVGFLQNAHAYVQASAYEGFGKTLIEAALANVPIITTDVGIVGEVFNGVEDDSGDVLATPPGDPTNLSVHISHLIEDMMLRKKLALHAAGTARAYLATMHTTPADIAADLKKLIS